MPIDANALGDRGEKMLDLALTSLHNGVPLFRPCSLGAKWPVCDFVVELWDSPGRVFLLQAKATSRPLGSRLHRVPIDISSALVGKLVSAPIPAYLAAIHEPTNRAYLAVPSQAKRITSLTSANCLNDAATRVALLNEVNQFWDGIAPFAPANSQFKD